MTTKAVRIVCIVSLLVIMACSLASCLTLSYGQAVDYKTDGKSYQVTVKIYPDKIVMTDNANKCSNTLNWYFSDEDLKEIKGSTWYYNYKYDVLFRAKGGVLYNMNDEGL